MDNSETDCILWVTSMLCKPKAQVAEGTQRLTSQRVGSGHSIVYIHTNTTEAETLIIVCMHGLEPKERHTPPKSIKSLTAGS